MSAAGAGAGIPQQPGQPIFGGRRPGYWIRQMNGRSTTLQAPDGSTVDVPTAHMPRGSAPGQPLDEQAFMAGHQQRQSMAQARSPFVQQLAQQGGAAEGAAAFTPRPVTPGMMLQGNGGTSNAQQIPVSQPPAVATPGAVSAAPLPPSAAAPPIASPASSSQPQASGPAVGTVEWLHSLAPDQQAKLASQVQGSSGANQLQNWRTVGNGTGSPASDAQIAMWLGGVVNSQQQAQTPSGQATAAYNAAQQQFTANNQGYATTGYLGNDAQVASQVAHGAQASSIPLGVLDSSFYQGGTNFGGAQNTDNTLSGNNGATNFAGSTFGVDPNAATPTSFAALLAARQALTGPQSGPSVAQSLAPITGGPVTQNAIIGNSGTPAGYVGGNGNGNGAEGTFAPPVTQNAQSGPGSSTSVSYAPATSPAGGPSSGSVDYAPKQPLIAQPTQGGVSGGGYTPAVTSNATRLTDAPQAQQQQNAQPATQKLSGAAMPTTTASPATTQQQSQPAPTDSAFQRALANAQVAPSTGPATESLKGRAHF